MGDLLCASFQKLLLMLHFGSPTLPIIRTSPLSVSGNLITTFRWIRSYSWQASRNLLTVWLKWSRKLEEMSIDLFLLCKIFFAPAGWYRRKEVKSTTYESMMTQYPPSASLCLETSSYVNELMRLIAIGIPSLFRRNSTSRGNEATRQQNTKNNHLSMFRCYVYGYFYCNTQLRLLRGIAY